MVEREELARDTSGQVVHTPVLLDRIVELLSPPLRGDSSMASSKWGGPVYVDGTLGMAGHAAAILAANPRAHLVGIDRDEQALQIAAIQLEPFGPRVHLVHARFDELPAVLDRLGLSSIDAMLLDLGLSSLQIDRRKRGFSYSVDAPLDMRMDERQALTAAAVLNGYQERDLVRVLRDYGEEKFSGRIARAIVARRNDDPFTNSAQLVAAIEEAIPAAVRYTGGHPAKRTFQALRIEVNGELDALRAVLPSALLRLAVGGRFAVLAYHSLEDRMVKRAFAQAASDQVPPDLPFVPEGLKAEMRLLTRGAEKPSVEEVAVNPRAASARLRCVERIRPPRTSNSRHQERSR